MKVKVKKGATAEKDEILDDKGQKTVLRTGVINMNSFYLEFWLGEPARSITFWNF